MTVSRSPLGKSGDAGLHPSAERAEPSYLRRTATTADSVGAPDKDKLVDLGVRVPKSLRRSVRAEAERRKITVDDLVAEALRDRTPR